jgi:DNA-binding response OmpR family regulator
MPTILIVEDEPKMQRLLELNLAEEGYAIQMTPSAEAALDRLRQGPEILHLDFFGGDDPGRDLADLGGGKTMSISCSPTFGCPA